MQVKTAVLDCPNCGTPVECVWAEPDAPDEDVEPQLQNCGGCARPWTAEYPGYSFRTEAG